MSPLQFSQSTLKLNTWSKIQEILEAVEQGHRKILVRSCNGAGKTTALAAICNWYFNTYDDSIVLTTASSWTQVRRNLWGEIKRQARAAKLYTGATRTATSITLSDKHFMLGISPNIPENAMGFHAPHVLIAVDEATGVSNEIMEALTGNLSSADSQIVMICNPIDKQSYPYNAEISGEWNVIHISAFDHPNVIDGNEHIKGAVTREWIEDRVRSWSFEVDLAANDAMLAESERAFLLDWTGQYYRKTARAQARILGEWAQLDEVGFIPMELITPNVYKGDYIPNAAVKVRAVGVDISRGIGRDATVYSTFDVLPDGPDVHVGFKMVLDEDLMATADRIANLYTTAKADGIALIIALDDTGLGGGVTDQLKRLEIPHFAVNFNNKARGLFPGKEISNARAEMYFVLHDDLLHSKVLLRDFKRFHDELSSTRLDISKQTGAYKMEDKDLTRQRLGHSLDYADATALARYAMRLEAFKMDKFI